MIKLSDSELLGILLYPSNERNRHYSGLSEDGPQRFTYWNTWSLVSGTVWEGSECVILLKECVTGGGLVFSAPAPATVLPPSQTLILWNHEPIKPIKRSWWCVFTATVKQSRQIYNSAMTLAQVRALGGSTRREIWLLVIFNPRSHRLQLFLLVTLSVGVL